MQLAAGASMVSCIAVAAHLAGAMHGPIHGRDRREINNTHVALERRVLHDLEGVVEARMSALSSIM